LSRIGGPKFISRLVPALRASVAKIDFAVFVMDEAFAVIAGLR